MYIYHFFIVHKHPNQQTYCAAVLAPNPALCAREAWRVPRVYIKAAARARHAVVVNQSVDKCK